MNHRRSSMIHGRVRTSGKDPQRQILDGVSSSWSLPGRLWWDHRCYPPFKETRPRPGLEVGSCEAGQEATCPDHVVSKDTQEAGARTTRSILLDREHRACQTISDEYPSIQGACEPSTEERGARRRVDKTWTWKCLIEMEFGFPISTKERPIFSSTRKGALGAKFGISCFGRRNEFLSRKIDRKSVGRGRQIFVKIRCDRSQIIHPRYNSNCAAEWVSGPKWLAKLARPLRLAASG